MEMMVMTITVQVVVVALVAVPVGLVTMAPGVAQYYEQFPTARGCLPPHQLLVWVFEKVDVA